MTELEAVDILEVLGRIQRIAIGEKWHDAAILAGLLSYMIFKEERNEKFQKAALVCMQVALNELEKHHWGSQSQSKRDSNPACSFCGRTEPQVRLAAGAAAFICNQCASTLSEVLKN